MGVFDGVLQETGGNQAGGVCHVYPEDGANLVCDFAHALVVPFAGIGRCTADDELGLALQRLALHLIVIYAAGFRIQAVGDGMIQDAGCVDGRTVGKVTAHGEVQSHESVSGAEDGHGDSHVGLGAGVGLDVGVFCVVQGAEAVDGQLLDLVHYLAAAIVALAGISFRVLVGADGAHGFQHLVGHIVLGGDELQPGRLTLLLFLDKVKNLKILFHKRN